MLFVPPSMPFMDPVPEAEAAPMDSPADAITDLSLVSISKKNNRSDRNSITLSWSAPNDNGSPIVFYYVQVHSISGSGWVTLENNVYGTTYTHDNGDQGVATGYQYSYRVFAIASSFWLIWLFSCIFLSRMERVEAIFCCSLLFIFGIVKSKI